MKLKKKDIKNFREKILAIEMKDIMQEDFRNELTNLQDAIMNILNMLRPQYKPMLIKWEKKK